MPDRPTLLEEAQEDALRTRALEMLRAAFPDYRIVYGGGRWAAAAAGDPPKVWFADTPSSLCGQLFLAELTNGGRVAPIRTEGR
ncbi:hypothetical protein HNP84_004768 [Thermocatellispora tengchongensis]|uniref:Uncharacterized protein n=1 Tax=Thermocatellispora tengchongensis TaxID=1073253 RepID=A0A840P6T6_9ACTN|nr:hypothetical protein [Thermocatellispora tengchongensis]MBB5135032.1 hypothetical protein [Thermocatellispora tengchongensis]